jgi:hypothetical protein
MIHISALYCCPNVPWYYSITLVKGIGSSIINHGSTGRWARYYDRLTMVKCFLINLTSMGQTDTLMLAGPCMLAAAALYLVNKSAIARGGLKIIILGDALHVGAHVLITVANLIIIVNF